MNDVWVKVKLPGELHAKFRTYVFNASTSMQGEIVRFVERLVESNYCGKSEALVSGGSHPSVLRGGATTPPPAAKTSPALISAPVKAPVDQKTCQHKYVKYLGRACVRCGYEPPVVG